MRTLLALAVVIALLTALPAACLATVNLYSWLQSQSPDGRMIEVNGAIWSDDANILGWVYDWGDGSANTGYFPMVHRYQWPGEFTVTVTGYDDAGDTTIVQFPINVPEPYSTDVVFVLCEPGCWSIKDTDSLEVRLFAFDTDWNRVSMEGRWVDVWYPGAERFRRRRGAGFDPDGDGRVLRHAGFRLVLDLPIRRRPTLAERHGPDDQQAPRGFHASPHRVRGQATCPTPSSSPAP